MIMGWSGGTELMETVIEAIAPISSSVDQSMLDATIIKIIKGFESKDWDCQNEMLGQHDFYDRAYFIGHPWDHGYYFAMGDTVALALPKPTASNLKKKWEEGNAEKLAEGSCYDED
jgi:hypothetical protein